MNGYILSCSPFPTSIGLENISSESDERHTTQRQPTHQKNRFRRKKMLGKRISWVFILIGFRGVGWLWMVTLDGFNSINSVIWMKYESLPNSYSRYSWYIADTDVNVVLVCRFMWSFSGTPDVTVRSAKAYWYVGRPRPGKKNKRLRYVSSYKINHRCIRRTGRQNRHKARTDAMVPVGLAWNVWRREEPDRDTARWNSNNNGLRKRSTCSNGKMLCSGGEKWACMCRASESE